MSSIASDFDCTPAELAAQATEATNLLPEISRNRYEEVYRKYAKWRQERNAKKTTENIILVYFLELAKTMKPSSVQAYYSMLRPTIHLKENENIGKYPRLRTYLKRQSVGYKRKKSKIFSWHQINQFLNTATDKEFLLTKVILIMGISGACRKQELRNLQANQVEDTGKCLIVKLPTTKTEKGRNFVVPETFYQIVKKYMILRPADIAPNMPFFLNFQKHKCTRQCVGVNKIGAVPKQIAQYLGLPEANLYTGHCFRKSAASLLVNAEDDRMQLNLDGWHSEDKHEKGHSSSLKSSQEINDSSSAVSDDDSATEEMYTGEADLDYENPTETKISDMIEVSDTQVISNVSETAKENPDLSTNVPFPTADECDVFGEYISKHLQQLPLSIALKLQSGIHELVMQTRLEYVRQNPNKAPPMVKEEKLIEEVEPTRPTTSPQYPQDPMKKRTEKRPRATDPPDPNKRPKPNTHSDSIITNQANDPRTDVDVFAKHIKMQLEQLPDLISLQLRSDIYAMIVQAKTKTLTKNDTEVPGNSVRIKDEVIETDHEDLIDSYDLLSS